LLDRYNKHSLIRIFAGVGVSHDIEQSVGFDGKNDFLEGNIPLCFQLFVLLVVPTKRLHAFSLAECVPYVITGWRRSIIMPSDCAQRRGRPKGGFVIYSLDSGLRRNDGT
jgi:hypothetical protein